jgi:phytoene dehydrogenase-like protein
MSSTPAAVLPGKTYDAVVIGAGMAGLMAAAFLARGGMKVCVLEANHQPGGLMAGIWRKGYYFDVGDQSFENGNIIFPLLKQLGIYDERDYLRAWYRFKAPNLDSLIKGPDDLPNAFAGAFPADAVGTHAFFDELHRDLRAIEPLLRNDHNPWLHEGAASNIATARFMAHVAVNAPRLWRLLHTRGSEVAEHYFTEDSAALDFFRRMGYRHMNTFVWLGFMRSWWHDYWYPVGGLQAMHDRLAARVVELGADIFYKRAVTKILTESSGRSDRSLRVVGVETAKGDVIQARHIIHTGDMKALYHRMLPDHRSLTGWREPILHGSLSEALTSVYLGVNISPDVVRACLQTHHTFYFPHFDIHHPHDMDDADLHARAWIEVSTATIDPQNEHLAPPGHSTIVVQTMARARWHNHWQMADDKPRDKDGYRTLKQTVTDQLVSTLGHLLPDVERHIVYSDVGSALSAARFTHNTGGTTAGWTFDPHAAPLRNRMLAIRTPVAGLLAGGHYAIWPGSVPTAALSGWLAASEALGTGFGKILHTVERFLPLPAYPPTDDPGITDFPE